jgi:hypothetical protein
MKTRNGLVVREVEGETVILDRSAGHLHTLNATASFIWHLMDANKTAKDIAREISQAFDIETGVAERDVATVIENLKDLQLVQE